MTRKQYRHDYYQRHRPPLKGQANARKTHCPAGHPYTPENTYTPLFSNTRACRTCNRERKRKPEVSAQVS